jgi:hypothetical protein
MTVVGTYNSSCNTVLKRTLNNLWLKSAMQYLHLGECEYINIYIYMSKFLVGLQKHMLYRWYVLGSTPLDSKTHAVPLVCFRFYTTGFKNSCCTIGIF